MNKGFFIIIRGPLACGKSTISKMLTKELNATYIAIDQVLEEHPEIKEKEEGYISQKTFQKVNDLILPKAKMELEKGNPVIFDGNFYWKSAIEDLISKLSYPHQIFTLNASVETCIARDKKRGETHGEIAARVVHKKTTSFEYGVEIDTENKTEKEVVTEILAKRV